MIWHYIEIIAAQQHQSWYKPNNFSCCFKHMSKHIFKQKILTSFTTLIRSIKYRLIIKLITWMDGKSRDKSIKTN